MNDFTMYEHTDAMILSDDLLESLSQNGYCIIPNFYDSALCDDMVEEAFEKLALYYGIERNDEKTWSNFPQNYQMVNLWHLNSMYTMRSDPRLYSVFAQLLKSHELIVSIDRMSFKPPYRGDDGLYEFPEDDPNEHLMLHTDCNYWNASSDMPQFQASVCLEDAPVNNGGFYCLPYFHRQDVVEQYMQQVESGDFGDDGPVSKKKVFLLFQDTERARNEKIEIPLKKGDLLIWNNFLPHNGGKNLLDQWRIQFFVRYLSLGGDHIHPGDMVRNNNYRSVVADCVTNGRRPGCYPTSNSVGGSREDAEKEMATFTPKTLSKFERRIYGKLKWHKVQH